MTIENPPLNVLRRLDAFAICIGGRLQSIRAIEPGLSVARVYRVVFDDQHYALRNWNLPANHLCKLSSKLEFQQRLSTSWPNTDINPIPRVIPLNPSQALLFEANDTLWSMSQWMSGETIPKEIVTIAAMQSAIATTATMHCCSLSNQTWHQRSKGWADRFNRLKGLFDESNWGIVRSTSSQQLAQLQQDSLAILRNVKHSELGRLIELAAKQASIQYACGWINGDLHVGNLLFNDDSVSGIVDFGAARIDWIAWDVIRLMTSRFTVDEIPQELLKEYASKLSNLCSQSETRIIESITSVTPMMLRDIAMIQQILSLYQWLQWSNDSNMVLSPAGLVRWQELINQSRT
jgi:thiamine kinase-like enzyme